MLSKIVSVSGAKDERKVKIAAKCPTFACFVLLLIFTLDLPPIAGSKPSEKGGTQENFHGSSTSGGNGKPAGKLDSRKREKFTGPVTVVVSLELIGPADPVLPGPGSRRRNWEAVPDSVVNIFGIPVLGPPVYSGRRNRSADTTNIQPMRGSTSGRTAGLVRFAPPDMRATVESDGMADRTQNAGPETESRRRAIFVPRNHSYLLLL